MTAFLRIAFRAEGDWWVAYLARTGTMTGAVEIARLRLAVAASDTRRRAFIGLCQSYLDDELAAMGMAPTGYDERPAPEHERSATA